MDLCNDVLYVSSLLRDKKKYCVGSRMEMENRTGDTMGNDAAISFLLDFLKCIFGGQVGIMELLCKNNLCKSNCHQQKMVHRCFVQMRHITES